MTLNYKNVTLLLIILSGYLVFSFNIFKLNLNNKNISIKEINQTEFIESPKFAFNLSLVKSPVMVSK